MSLNCLEQLGGLKINRIDSGSHGHVQYVRKTWNWRLLGVFPKCNRKVTNLKRTRICHRIRTGVSEFFGALFEPWAVLGQKSTPRAPETIFSIIFYSFWIHSWLMSAFPHLSATTFCSVHWFFQKRKAYTRDVKWEPKMSLAVLSERNTGLVG